MGDFDDGTTLPTLLTMFDMFISLPLLSRILLLLQPTDGKVVRKVLGPSLISLCSPSYVYVLSYTFLTNICHYLAYNAEIV